MGAVPIEAAPNRERRYCDEEGQRTVWLDFAGYQDGIGEPEWNMFRKVNTDRTDESRLQASTRNPG